MNATLERCTLHSHAGAWEREGVSIMALTREDLYSLEKYSEIRNEFRTKVMAHKKHRQVSIGEYARLYFEDQLIMHYQVQEMLRAEKIFDAAGINEELEAYNPLIPDGTNLKVTFMLQYSDPDERKVALSTLIGIERKTWVQFAGFDKVYPVTNEDLIERETEEKTSAIHFMRFEFSAEMIAAAKEGAALNMGIEHEHYNHVVMAVAENIRASLVCDFS
jgi:hypothetical protein